MVKKLYRAAITLPNGKRKWISSATEEGLEQKRREALLLIGNTSMLPNDVSFGEYAEMWFKVYKVPYLRDKSLLALRNALDNHIYPYLQNVPLKSVSQFQVQMIFTALAKKSKSLNTKVIQILRGVFNTAIDNNLIEKSPVPITLKVSGKATKEKVALTREQSEQLLSAVRDTRAYLFCLIALQTGMRRGEICGLMWKDIDLEKRVIHVRHNAVLTSAQTVVSEALKTSAAVRDIPIPPTLLNELQTEEKQKKGDYVLHMDNGKPLSHTSFSNLWDMERRRTVDNPADLGTVIKHSTVVRSLDFHVSPHLLRHTYITRLFEGGLDIKEVQYLAGHSTIEMTLRVYTHYQRESRKNETAKKVFAVLG